MALHGSIQLAREIFQDMMECRAFFERRKGGGGEFDQGSTSSENMLKMID